ncbi:MAG: hypothetical protein ACRDUX_05050 [Mycobacterium sp.]
MVARLRGLVPLGTVIVVLAAAAMLWHSLPTPSEVYAPFDEHGSIGAPVSGRDITATVTRVRIADRVVDTTSRDPQSIRASGRWVVVDTTLAVTAYPALPHVELLVGPNTYAPADRFTFTSWVSELAPGIAMTGPWVFEVAPAVLDAQSTKELVLRVWVGDGRLDSRLVIGLPLDAPQVGRLDEVALQPEVAAS